MKKKVLLGLSLGALALSLVGCDGPYLYSVLNKDEWESLFNELITNNNFTLNNISNSYKGEKEIAIIIKQGDLRFTNQAIKGVLNGVETYAAYKEDVKSETWYELEQDDTGIYKTVDILSENPYKDILGIFKSIGASFNSYAFGNSDSRYITVNPIEYTTTSGVKISITNEIQFSANLTLVDGKYKTNRNVSYFNICCEYQYKNQTYTQTINFQINDIGTTIVKFPKRDTKTKPGEVTQDIWNTAFSKFDDDKKNFVFSYTKHYEETQEYIIRKKFNVTPNIEDELDFTTESVGEYPLVKNNNNVYHKIYYLDGSRCELRDYPSLYSYSREILKDYQNKYSYSDFEYNEISNSYLYKSTAAKETDVEIFFNNAKKVITKIVKIDEYDSNIVHTLEFSKFDTDSSKSKYKPDRSTTYNSETQDTRDSNEIFMKRIFGENGSGGLNVQCEYHRYTNETQDGPTQYLTMYNKSNFKMRSSNDEENKFSYYKETSTDGTYECTDSEGTTTQIVKSSIPGLSTLYNTEQLFTIFNDIGHFTFNPSTTEDSFYHKIDGSDEYFIIYNPNGDGQVTLKIATQPEAEKTITEKFVFTKYNLTAFTDVAAPKK